MHQHDIIRQSLRELSHAERCAMLLVSVVEQQSEAYAAASGVLQVLAAMTGRVNGLHRAKLAGRLIGLAEQLKSPVDEEKR